jgi:rRNA processing protein Krr1/Pno1
LIGKQGQTIQALTKRTGARITVPKQDGPANEDDEDATVDVTIEGDAVSARYARDEVQKIIDARSTGSNLSLKDVPPEFYPFLAGVRQSNIDLLTKDNNLNVHIPTYHTWQGVPPAQPAGQGQPAPFIAQPSLPIRISGDRQAAQEARAKIERRVNVLKRQLTSQQLAIERGRHQFIIGQNGQSLHDLLEETGCSVILPPPGDDSEELYIVGPPGNIDLAVNKILDIAASMAVSNVDVARQHAKAPPAHAHNVSRYLRDRQAIADLERQYAANFVLPTSQNAPQNWQIFSSDGKQNIRARTDAMNLISAHPPSRFHTYNVNPFYHTHLQKQAPQVRKEHGVHLLFPLDNPESNEVIVVYEQPGSPSEYQIPRQAPTPQQIQEHQKAVQAAVKFLDELLGPQEDIVSRHVEAPPKQVFPLHSLCKR